MAEMLSKDEVRNYPLSNGTTVDLIEMIGTDVPNDWRHPVLQELVVGQTAYVDALGAMRRGVITKLGRTRVHVAFTTQGAVDEAARRGTSDQARVIRVQTTTASVGSVLVAPLSVPAPADSWADLVELAHEEALTDAKQVEDPRQWATEGTEYPARKDWDTDLDEIEASEEQAVAQRQEQVQELDRLDAELATWEAEGGAPMPVFLAPGQAPSEPQSAEQEPAVPHTGSTVVEALEAVWQVIRAEHPELPGVVIVTGSGMIGPARWGHFRAQGWIEKDSTPVAPEVEQEHTDLMNHVRTGEMFIAGETLAKGAAHTLETMLHEAAHVLAGVREIQDTSRQGRWHNGQFRKLASELGLEYTKQSAHPQVGFSEVLLTEATTEKYADVIEDLDRAIRLTIALPEFLKGTASQGGEHMHHGGRRPKGEGTGSSSNNLKLTCVCEEPRIIRASKKVAEAGQIFCRMCDEYFEVRD